MKTTWAFGRVVLVGVLLSLTVLTNLAWHAPNLCAVGITRFC